MWEAVKRQRTVADRLLSKDPEALKGLEILKNPENSKGSGSHRPISVPGCRNTSSAESGRVRPHLLGPWPRPKIPLSLSHSTKIERREMVCLRGGHRLLTTRRFRGSSRRNSTRPTAVGTARRKLKSHRHVRIRLSAQRSPFPFTIAI